MSDGCGASLAACQWWKFCGETDMGQTLPALCTSCGGQYIREDGLMANHEASEKTKLSVVDAQKMITKILRDLEKSTGQLVESICLTGINVTSIEDAAPKYFRSVSVELKPVPGHDWMT